MDLELIDENTFFFCWVVDYPMYEYNENLKKIVLVTILSQYLKETLKN